MIQSKSRNTGFLKHIPHDMTRKQDQQLNDQLEDTFENMYNFHDYLLPQVHFR